MQGTLDRETVVRALAREAVVSGRVEKKGFVSPGKIATGKTSQKKRIEAYMPFSYRHDVIGEEISPEETIEPL